MRGNVLMDVKCEILRAFFVTDRFWFHFGFGLDLDRILKRFGVIIINYSFYKHVPTLSDLRTT